MANYASSGKHVDYVPRWVVQVLRVETEEDCGWTQGCLVTTPPPSPEPSSAAEPAVEAQRFTSRRASFTSPTIQPIPEIA
jgi:hypothetical protein